MVRPPSIMQQCVSALIANLAEYCAACDLSQADCPATCRRVALTTEDSNRHSALTTEDSKSKAGCVDCTGRERASVEGDTTGRNGIGQEGMSFCYRKDEELDADEAACDSYWGGSVDNPTYGAAYYGCELGVKAETGREGCINGPECCLDSNGEFTAPTATPTADFTLALNNTTSP